MKKSLNSSLSIAGVLLTMVDERTNYAKDIISLLNETYGSNMRIFSTKIPFSVKAAETSAAGRSIFEHAPKCKVADAYRAFVDEYLGEEMEVSA